MNSPDVEEPNNQVCVVVGNNFLLNLYLKITFCNLTIYLKWDLVLGNFYTIYKLNQTYMNYYFTLKYINNTKEIGANIISHLN